MRLVPDDGRTYGAHTRHVIMDARVKPAHDAEDAATLARPLPVGTARSVHAFAHPTHAHILNTPNFVSGTGALSAALNAKANTRRVSDGAMMPSSHSRAVA